ncbi:Complement component C6, partial [Ophiophagus hannah]
SACHRPAASDVVSIFPLKNEYNVGETIRLSCASTFRLTGHSEYTCVSGPSWHPAVMRLLTCEKGLLNEDIMKGMIIYILKATENQEKSKLTPNVHYSEDVCVLDATSEQALTKPSCPYLAEKCLDQHSFHFLHSGLCRSGTDVSWANERLRIATDSIKREPCGYDTCYDWEQCSESHGKCVCLLPNQCPHGGQPISCVQIRTRKITANLCMLGALKCSKTDINCFSGSAHLFVSRAKVLDDYYNKNFCDQLCQWAESRACSQQACPINCQLGDWEEWSECDPCVKKQFRVRPLLQPSQFGGQASCGQMVDDRPCFPEKLCNIEEVNCANKFQCDNGRCVARKLECNGENDCGDNSDEQNCRKIKPVCQSRLESIPSVQLMGLGYHILAGETRGEILDYSFNNGSCVVLKSENQRTRYRLPANLYNISFEVKTQEDDVITRSYTNLTPLIRSHDKTSSSRQVWHGTCGIPYFWGLKNLKRSLTKKARETITFHLCFVVFPKSSNYIRIHKVFAVSNFMVKEQDLQLSAVFLRSLNNLPLEYNYALYSRIFDDFGTHYYTSGLTTEQMENCVQTETQNYVFFFKSTEYDRFCRQNKLTERYEGSMLKSSERSISLVKGGQARYAAALAWERKGSLPGHEIFNDWLESAKNNPVVIDFEVSPIVDLVKNFPCSATKRFNLRKAFSEYMSKYDPCHCAPCPNNAQPVLSETGCLCVCKSGTYGSNCELRAPDYKSVAVDGYWSCWSAWSACDASFKRQRTRLCNNPEPMNGGKPCNGDAEDEEQCFISIFKSQGATCVNDDDYTGEGRIKPKCDTGCFTPEAPENGLIRNEKSCYDVGEQAEVLCFSGYFRSGYPFLRCLPDKTWAQQNVECQWLACDKPSVSDAVHLTPFKIQYDVGDKIYLSCPRGTGSEGICVLDVQSEQAVTNPSCHFLAEKCRNDEQVNFIHNGPCSDDTRLTWAIERANLSANARKKDPCGYDCPKGEEQVYCIQYGSRNQRRTSTLCVFGAMKCANMKATLLHPGK